MAANKTIKIGIDLEAISTLKTGFEEGKKRGSFNGPGGQEARTRISGGFDTIEQLSKKRELTKLELKELAKAVKLVTETLTQFLPKGVKISEAVQKLTNSLIKQRDALEKLQTERGNKQKEQADVYDEINKMQTQQGYSFYKKGKDGQATKVQLKDPEAILKNEAAGSLVVKQNGKDIQDQSGILQTLKTHREKYDKLGEAIVDLTKKINDQTAKITDTEQKIAKQEEEDKASGASDFSMSEINKAAGSLGKNVQSGFDTFKDLQVNETKAAHAIQTTTAAINKQSSALGKAFKAFTLYSVVIRSAKSALKAAVKTVKDLDKYLTEQAMVTGKTRKETYALVGEYQKLAKETGATTKEIASVATEYMKQGKTIKESLTLTKAAVSAAKVARVSVGDSVNYLTTALNGFRLSANDAMKVSDKFAAVAASSATDYDELAIALSKVASQANLAGMSIDYTTALLTKGLETTREAPETMGTALKTIIARMRELGDYGETLEDGTDINNVETQLAYVGIALRDAKGELRSTEEVLDELGRKWETLDSNQQAAVAKALAGTRQQSRLIAMMEDYDRVIELQDIAQRSQGATLAQSETYLEGMEAAMNDIAVAWESIITSLTDSDVIVGAFKTFAKIIEGVGRFLDTDIGSVTLVTTLIAATTGLLAKKQIENQITRDTKKLQEQELILNLEKQKAYLETQRLVTETAAVAKAKADMDEAALKLKIAEGNVEKANNNVAEIGLKIEKEKTNQLVLQRKVQEGQITTKYADQERRKSNKNIAELEKDRIVAQEEQTKAQKEVKLAIEESNKAQENYKQTVDNLDASRKNLLKTDTEYKNVCNQINYLQTQQNSILFSGYRMMALRNIIEKASIAISAIKSIFVKKETKELKKNTVETNKNTVAQTKNWIARLGPFALAIAAIAAVAVGIYALIKIFGDTESATEKASKAIKKLSNEIYKLNESKNSLDGVVDQFEALDEKIIKTNKDLEEMESLLDGASEKIDFTRGGKFDEDEAEARKANFEGLTDQQKINWLKEEQLAIDTEIAEKRKQQIEEFTKEGVITAKLLEDAELASAIYATNNAYLYDQVDALKKSGRYTDEELKATEKIGEAIMENLSAQEALNWAQSEHAKKLADQLAKTGSMSINGESVMLSEVLTSDAYGLENQIKAYKEIAAQLSGDTLEAFNKAYQHLYDFSNSFSANSITLITNLGLTADEINKLATAMRKLGVEEELLTNRMEKLIVYTGNGMSIQDAIKSVFADQLEGLTGEEYENAYNTILNAWIDATGVGINNMGQEVDKLQNKINNFYTNATKWGEMSANEQAQFIADNAELFKDNAELLEAFSTGDYAVIEAALGASDTLKKQREKLVTQLQTELANEEAKLPENQNVAYMQYLKQQIAYWEDTENIWKASLKDILDKEKQQLDDYKSYLEEKNKAEEEALNKRKEAYEKYFDSIAEMEEDQDYEDQVDLLSSNLAKLGSSTDANSMNQKKELENQLKELEQERLKELRERAQEAIIENIDDQIAEMNDTLDKLLESNRALLAAMSGELTNANEFVANRLATEISTGATANELQSWIGNLSSVYGGKLGDINLADMKIREENNNLYLTVNGREVQLDTSSQQSVYDAIMKALTQVGGI